MLLFPKYFSTHGERCLADKRKCPIHNTWMKKYRNKGQPICEQCLMDRDAQIREYEKLGGMQSASPLS